MAERILVETSLYYDENVVNYVAIHLEDGIFLHTNHVEILNEYGMFQFEVIIKLTVTLGAIALNRFQRRKYHLKKYRTYLVRCFSPKRPSRTLFDILNERFDFKSKVGGMERVLEEIVGDVFLAFILKVALSK